MQEYDGQPCRKRSKGKATWPGNKQVFRVHDTQGKMQEDYLAMEDELLTGDPLLKPCMRNGKRLSPPAPLEQLRTHAARQLDQLPEALRSLNQVSPYPVHISQKIRDLADHLDQQSP
jgi:nicotinate phosphoribosyltransferase